MINSVLLFKNYFFTFKILRVKIFSLKENEIISQNSFQVLVDHSLIIVLKQTRTMMSFEGLQSLASSIKKNGQQNPGIIFAFQKSQAKKYLYNINKLWHRQYKIEEFESIYIKEKQNNYYLILVAGHRRLEAVKIAEQKYFAQIYFGKSFKEAITAQYEENFHEEIPLYDLVNFASFFWVMSKTEDEKLTLKSFAKSIHKSTTWLSNALKFTGLPVSIQELINSSEISKGVNYSIMIEFAKFYEISIRKEKPISEDLLLSFISQCIVHKYNLGKVKEFIEIRKQELFGQQALFELESQEINSGTLTELRKSVTLDISRVNSYLTAVDPIAKRITKKARFISDTVLRKGKELRNVLTSK